MHMHMGSSEEDGTVHETGAVIPSAVTAVTTIVRQNRNHDEQDDEENDARYKRTSHQIYARRAGHAADLHTRISAGAFRVTPAKGIYIQLMQRLKQI